MTGNVRGFNDGQIISAPTGMFRASGVIQGTPAPSDEGAVKPKVLTEGEINRMTGR